MYMYFIEWTDKYFLDEVLYDIDAAKWKSPTDQGSNSIS